MHQFELADPVEQLSKTNGQEVKKLRYTPRYSTKDHLIQESIKHIFNSELCRAVKNCHSMLLLKSVFYVFMAKNNSNLKKYIVHIS